jgi:uncharacterized protein (UPF0248 family)
MNLRELFNDRKWHRGDLRELVVTVRHRGAPGDERTVLGGEITDIRPGGLVVAVDVEVYEDGGVEDGAVFIPWHRVLKVAAPEGILWERTNHADD